MKQHNLKGEMERLAKTTQELRERCRANRHVADRVESRARVRAIRAKEAMAGARNDQELMAAQADYVQAQQDRHIALVCGASADRHVRFLKRG